MSISVKLPADQLAALRETYLSQNSTKAQKQESLAKIADSALYIAKEIASKFRGPNIDRDELVSVGMLAIIKALEKFKPGFTSKKTGQVVNFYTYAFWWIREKIYSFVKKINKHNLITLGMLCGENGEEFEIEDKTTGPQEQLEKEEERTWLNDKISRLKGHHKDVMQLLNEGDNQTTIGLKLGITRSRVSQIVKLNTEILQKRVPQ